MQAVSSKLNTKDCGHSCKYTVTSSILNQNFKTKIFFFFTLVPWLAITPLICSPFQQNSMKKLSILGCYQFLSSYSLSSVSKALPQWSTVCSWQSHLWLLHCWVWWSVFTAFSPSSLIFFTCSQDATLSRYNLQISPFQLLLLLFTPFNF